MFNDPLKEHIATLIMEEIARHDGFMSIDVVNYISVKVLENLKLHKKLINFEVSLNRFEEHGWILVTFDTNTGWHTDMSIDVKHQLREQKINNLLD